jgi:hypothetical protein
LKDLAGPFSQDGHGADHGRADRQQRRRGHHLGERIIDVLNDVGADDDERVLALLSVPEFTIAVVECPACQKQMIKALRQAIPDMLRNSPS